MRRVNAHAATCSAYLAVWATEGQGPSHYNAFAGL